MIRQVNEKQPLAIHIDDKQRRIYIYEVRWGIL